MIKNKILSEELNLISYLENIGFTNKEASTSSRIKSCSKQKFLNESLMMALVFSPQKHLLFYFLVKSSV